MKNNFFTHKFLPIIGVFLLVAFSLCTSCFASSSYVEFGNIYISNFHLPDYENGEDSYFFYNYKLYLFDSSKVHLRYVRYVDKPSLVAYENRHVIWFYHSNGKMIFDNELEDQFLRCFRVSMSKVGLADDGRSIYSFDDFTLLSPVPSLMIDDRNVTDDYISDPFNNGRVVSNRPIYSFDGSSVVFQGAPQVEEVPKVELMKATQVEEIPQQIVAVVMIVLPIFLAIFGVLLVLYLIKSKNLLQL